MIDIWMTPSGHDRLEAKRNHQLEMEIANEVRQTKLIDAEYVPEFMLHVLLSCAFMCGEVQFAGDIESILAYLMEHSEKAVAVRTYNYIMSFDVMSGMIFPRTLGGLKNAIEKRNN